MEQASRLAGRYYPMHCRCHCECGQYNPFRRWRCGWRDRAADSELVAVCRKLHGCETGEAKITPGFKLPAQFIIHTVGPIYARHPQKEAELLRNCYKNCLAITSKHDIYSISFLATSCGVYGYPAEEVAHIAITTVMAKLPNYTQLEKIIFVVFSDRSEEIYRNHIYLLEKT